MFIFTIFAKIFKQIFFMSTININIKCLIGNVIVVTTPENASQDLEAKITTTILKAIQHLQVQYLDHQESNSDKSDQQSPNH